MIIVNNIKCPITKKFGVSLIAKKLNCKENMIKNFTITNEALDARFDDAYYVYNVIVDIKDEQKYLKKKDVSIYKPVNYPTLKASRKAKVAVVGYGPSGIFAALTLAKAGLEPVIFERGSKVEKRVKDVEEFWQHNKLNTESNVQYGEGGAGTFSDGKLTTRIKDYRVKDVLQTLVDNGADPKILYQHLPHIGTDKLRDILVNIRNNISDMGGTFYFDTKVEKLAIKNNKIIGLWANGKYYDFEYVILCIGHSSFDTFKNLYDNGVYIEQKDFAIGLRVEHPQALINKNQCPKHYNKLPSASYRLSYTASNNRGVYSFCMCPGGIVVNSACENNTIVTNGMSYSTRDMDNANSAILVQVFKDDFNDPHPLAGFNYQLNLEKKAFNITNTYKALAQNIGDYLNNDVNDLVIESSFTNGVKLYDLNNLFSDDINTALHEAFVNFDKKIPGFINQGIMVAPETRSSCPVRIKRNEYHQSISTANLYPCGEGAGYAGGIVSSGVDGIRCAQSLITNLKDDET